jgi:phospholipid-translocating ATPase
VVKVYKNQYFPSILLLLSSSDKDGVCYVETMNLDEETNLKVKRWLEATLGLNENEEFRKFKGTICCEDPNPNLYTYVGNFEFEIESYPLCPAQLLLRDSKLRKLIIFMGW